LEWRDKEGEMETRRPGRQQDRKDREDREGGGGLPKMRSLEDEGGGR